MQNNLYIELSALYFEGMTDVWFPGRMTDGVKKIGVKKITAGIKIFNISIALLFSYSCFIIFVQFDFIQTSSFN
jgi:hypothetical protein